ncbi:MAG: WecB/TagA/CpsF family glycosyltransferase [Clostridia bacterium]
MERIDILGINFDNITLNQAVKTALEYIENDEKGYVVTPNSEIVHMCMEDEALKNIVNRANLILPDGIGIIYAGKILKTPLKGKVAGVEFSETLVAKMEDKSLFILGGKPDVARKACENLSSKYKKLRIAGYKDGYFKNDEEALDEINKQEVDVLFVCLGVPKQEKFIYDNLEKINAKVICAIGGSADVFAGEVKRAPKIFIKLGLEWFYRLLKQPSRIGRMIRLPLFIIEVFKYKKGRKI